MKCEYDDFHYFIPLTFQKIYYNKSPPRETSSRREAPPKRSSKVENTFKVGTFALTVISYFRGVLLDIEEYE